MSCLYKSLISQDLCSRLLEHYRHISNDLPPANTTSSMFPPRIHLRDVPDDICADICKELLITLQGYYINIEVNPRNVRVYHSKFGRVKPHTDASTYGDTHTCLIYLTDDFDGGNLTVKLPRSESHILEHGCKDMKHVTVTPEPRACYGIIFPKSALHYTNDQLEGDKIIVLVDINIIE